MNTKSTFARRVSAMSLLFVLSAGVQAGITTRVSVDSAGRQSNDEPGGDVSISADGRYVAFSSNASNLVLGDTLGGGVLVHDRQTGATTRVSVDSAGRPANRYSLSYSPSLSADGRFVAFHSDASNLVLGDTNDHRDVFVHDRQTGATTRVSVDSAGQQGNDDSEFASVSANGRYVAFISLASNLVPGDTNDAYDVFVHDRRSGATTRISLNSAGEQGNSHSFTCGGTSLSDNGRYVAFISSASNLVLGDTNDYLDIFVHDRQTGATTRVSVNRAGGQGNAASFPCSLSAEGRYVAFSSEASNFIAGDTNEHGDVFVHDRQSGATSRVSVNSAGEQGNHRSYEPFISADGRYIAYSSYASNLVPGDTNGTWDILIHDRQTGTASRVSENNEGRQANTYSFTPVLSADGRYAAFLSGATNLVRGDTNRYDDIFVHDRLGVLLEGPAGAPSCTDGFDNDSDGAIDAADVDCTPISPPIFCNGRLVTITGTPWSDFFIGTTGNDVIAGLGGDDVLDGAGGNDVICGGSGNDTLIGGSGKDRLFGGVGDDVLKGGAGNDKLKAGPGSDRCDGQAGTDTHLGGCETLTNVP